MFRQVSSALTEEVKWQCDNTATADVQSAFEVFEYYCSAAEDLVVAEVSESISSTINTGSVSARTSAGSSSPAETGGSNSASQTEGGNQQGGGGENNAANGDGDESTTEASRVAVIAGAVVGSVLFIVGIAVIAFFIRRRRLRSKNGEPLPAVPPHGGHEYHGKPELAGPDAVVSRPGTGYVDPDHLKPELPTAASYNELPTPTTPSQSPRPMWPQGATAPPPVPELSPAQDPRPELYGAGPTGHSMAYGQPPQELSSPGTSGQPQPYLNGQPVHEFPSPVTPVNHGQQPWQQPPPSPYQQDYQNQYQQYQQPYQHQHQHQVMSWQSGPIQSYEMEANPGRRN